MRRVILPAVTGCNKVRADDLETTAVLPLGTTLAAMSDAGDMILYPKIHVYSEHENKSHW